jgi:hypothetical protein
MNMSLAIAKLESMSYLLQQASMDLTQRRHERYHFSFFPCSSADNKSLKPTNNPTHSTDPSPGRLPQALPPHQHRRVVRFVGCIRGFYPGVDPILFPQHTTYLPANSEGSPYRPGLDTPHYLDRYSHCTRLTLKIGIEAETKKNGVLGVCSGFLPEKPRPRNPYRTWATGNYRGFWGFISTTGEFLKMTIEVR